tara:strand:+ start:4852 stop:5487 length:636 start_codon:yes stop_codon:yes gene_type:complete
MLNNHIQTKFEKDIGNGTVSNDEFPFDWFYNYGYGATIYTREALGLCGKVRVKGLRFEFTRTDQTSAEIFTDQHLYLGQCDQDEFKTNVRNGMYQNPYNANPGDGWLAINILPVKLNFTIDIPQGTAYHEILFDDYYEYDPNKPGYPNLLVYWKNRRGNYEGLRGTPYVNCQSTGKFDTYYDNSDYLSMTDATAGTRDSTGRPNIELIIEV